jgi:hypothetical protein
MKPVQQVFALVLHNILLSNNKVSKIVRFNKECEKLKINYPDKEKYQEKVESLKNKEIKSLLFDKFLRVNNNHKEKNNPITNFFSKHK